MGIVLYGLSYGLIEMCNTDDKASLFAYYAVMLGQAAVLLFEGWDS